MTAPIALNAPLAADAGQAIISLYSEATEDYRFWSPDNLNMHFGYGSLRHLFDREAMLEAMNARVLDALDLVDRDGTRVVDLGCGTGATIRHGVRKTTHARFTGVTLSPEHARRAREMNARISGADRLDVIRANYLATPLDDASFDGGWAVESACHAPGSDKAALIAEAARLLKPGAKLVMADAFRTDRNRPLGGVAGAAYRAMCRNWALPGLAEVHDLTRALALNGFEDIHVEDISWQVALSVLHVPFVSLAFFLACLRRGQRPAGWRLSNAFASVLAMLVGLMRWRFSYCIVTATRCGKARYVSPPEVPDGDEEARQEGRAEEGSAEARREEGSCEEAHTDAAPAARAWREALLARQDGAGGLLLRRPDGRA